MPISELVLVIMGLLTVAMLAASIGRNLPVPYTVFLVVIGMVLAALANRIPLLEPLQNFRLTPDLVFFIFLPALIFESALTLDARQLLRDIAPILVLAVPALVVSTVLIGVGVWAYMDLDLTLALLFGALIAATDPVAVVALFKELGAPARLTTLVEGESLFNDATAIVVFHILLGIALAGTFTASDIGHAAVEFIRVFFGGVLVGAVAGFGIGELMRRIRGSELAILIMSFVMAYSSFVVAEHLLHVSGVMAAVSAAVAMGLFAITRIPRSALRSIHETWEVIALVCNSLLFLMIGLSVNLGPLIDNLDGIFVAALLVLVARAAAVYALVPATTRLFSLPHVNMGERHIMWWGGLKGGLAIAIVLSIPETLDGRQILVELTLGVVLLTLLINAPSIRPLITWLGLDRMSEQENAELRRGLLEAQQQAHAVIERLATTTGLPPARVDSVRSQIDGVFEYDVPAVDPSRHLRHAYLEALRMETEELESLYTLGVIQEYTYLDLRNRIRRDRIARSDIQGTYSLRDAADGYSGFARLEQFALHWLRERNAFAGVLARLQRVRLSQVIQRDIAAILCAEAVIANLPERVGLTPHDTAAVIALYRERLGRKRARLQHLREDFPEFYADLESRLTRAAALTRARQYAVGSHHSGDIGAKAFGRIDRRLASALASLPAKSGNGSGPTAVALIARVPLFRGLPDRVLEKLAAQARTVTFLPGDVVIGEGEKGNALYILMHGSVEVVHGVDDAATRVALLGQGDIFGERALLHDEIRSANVIAVSALTLLRLTRASVRALADEHGEIAARLQRADQARR